MNPLLFTDFYKVEHFRQYPKGLTKVYSNFTPRISRVEGVKEVLVYGVSSFIYTLKQIFDEYFFSLNITHVIKDYLEVIGKPDLPTDHIRALHALGYLPLQIKALKEGTLCPLKTPLLTITNTHPDFYWLPNFLETYLSCELWHPISVATLAFQYRKTLEHYANKTSDMREFVKWQGHDFSMRGQVNLSAAMMAGGAHLTCFHGSDTLPAFNLVKNFHNDGSRFFVGGSVPATEHSIMCFGGRETERDTYLRLLTEVYPTGVVSIVSDTWDYWRVIRETLPSLKDVIMSRAGKLVVRPDSGDPVKILCGDSESEDPLAKRGTVEALWDIFGGVVNSKGYRQLDSHIGVIYGDSITLERCSEICKRLEVNGFASTNVVFGIGSYTYQYITRDTFGFAMKATYGEIDGCGVEIYKDPLTDGGVKKSAKGLLRVNEDLTLSECVSADEEKDGLLKPVFLNGAFQGPERFDVIRERVDGYFA